MINLSHSLKAWGTPDYAEQLKAELELQPAAALPLQQGLVHSSYVSGDPFRIMVIDVRDDGAEVHAKVGAFYSGIIAGCSCSDDPTPTDVLPEYCEFMLGIDKASGQAMIQLLG